MMKPPPPRYAPTRKRAISGIKAWVVSVAWIAGLSGCVVESTEIGRSASALEVTAEEPAGEPVGHISVVHTGDPSPVPECSVESRQKLKKLYVCRDAPSTLPECPEDYLSALSDIYVCRGDAGDLADGIWTLGCQYLNDLDSADIVAELGLDDCLLP
jgi:hypothetical protein